MLGKFGISIKMLSAFAVLLLILAAVGYVAIVKISAVNDLSKEMRSRWLPATQLLGEIHAYTSQYRMQQSALVSSETQADKEKFEKLLRNGGPAISSAIDEYEPLMVSQEQRQVFESLASNWLKFTQLSKKMTTLVEANDPTALDLFKGESLNLSYAVEDDILQLLELNENGGAALSNKSEQIYAQSQQLMMIAAFTSLIVTSILASLLMRTFVTPLSEMSDVVKRLVEGDLDIQIKGTARGDELGSLARALERFKILYVNEQERAHADLVKAKETDATITAIGQGLSALAQGKLRHRVTEDVTGPLSQLHLDYNEVLQKLFHTMQEIMDEFHIIKSGSNEIVHASSDLSVRTEKQAKSLADTAITLEKFSQSVQIAADNSKITSSRLTLARSSAENVDETAKCAVVAMRNIASSSKEMNEIITTIDGL